MLKEFFKDDTILVTGASGLVGRNLFELLKKENCNVIGTYLENEREELTKCDLTKYKEVETLIFKKNIRYVFMVAAKTYGADVLKNNPSAMVMDTIAMNANVLEASYKKQIFNIHNNVKKILYISSSVVYQHSFKPLVEDDLDWNQNPYHMYMGVGWVKRYIEKLCEFYHNLGMNINIIRPANIYGKYDKYKEGKSHFIPAIVKRVLEKQNPLVIWGKGYNVKDVIYIDDFLRDMLDIFINYDKVDAINVCAGKTYTIDEIVRTIIKVVGGNIQPTYDPTKPDSVPYKCLIKNKFETLFGKRKYITLEDGLKEVIKWLKQELNI